MRASDDDRQRTVDELRRHCAAGRIDVDEYASRIERALAATTLEELDQIRSDLPMLRIAEPAGRQVRGIGESAAGAIGAGSGGSNHRFPGGLPDQRVLALGVAVLTVVVVLAAIGLSLVAQWTWAVVLLAGWAVGVAQGRLTRSSRRAR